MEKTAVTFTPGPWKAFKDRDNDAWAVKQIQKSKLLDAFSTTYICADIQQGEDGGEADAKLIAAAPVLFAALTKIYEAIKRDRMLEQFGLEENDYINRALTAAS